MLSFSHTSHRFGHDSWSPIAIDIGSLTDSVQRDRYSAPSTSGSRAHALLAACWAYHRTDQALGRGFYVCDDSIVACPWPISTVTGGQKSWPDQCLLQSPLSSSLVVVSRRTCVVPQPFSGHQLHTYMWCAHEYDAISPWWNTFSLGCTNHHEWWNSRNWWWLQVDHEQTSQTKGPPIAVHQRHTHVPFGNFICLMQVCLDKTFQQNVTVNTHGLLWYQPHL